MEVVVNLWEDLQFTYHFEGLLVFCSGKTNTLADIASRVNKNKVRQTLAMEIARQGLGELQIVENEVTWAANGIDINIEDELMANQRKRKLQNMTATEKV